MKPTVDINIVCDVTYVMDAIESALDSATDVWEKESTRFSCPVGDNVGKEQLMATVRFNTETARNSFTDTILDISGIVADCEKQSAIQHHDCSHDTPGQGLRCDPTTAWEVI